MNVRLVLTLIMILTFGLPVLSCKWLSRKSYKVDKLSPNETYRVRVDVSVEDYEELLGGFHEWGKIEIFKGDEILSSQEWNFKDNFEATFIEGTPVIEWVGNNVLRMGRDQKDLPFLDEVLVLNNSVENLKYVNVTCDKHEQLSAFDLAPGGQITLRASPVTPWTDSNGALKYALGYGGKSETGKQFSGILDEKQRTVSGNGSAKFEIVIRQQDLQ